MLAARIASLAAVATLAMACGVRGPVPSAGTRASNMCVGIGPLLDLRSDLAHASDIGGSTEASALVVTGELLGALQRRELDEVTETSMVARRQAAIAALMARRALLLQNASTLETTYQNVEHALDQAAQCKGKDLRAPGLPVGATRRDRELAEHAPPSEQRKAATRKDLLLFESPACADATRLWSSLRSLDLTSKSSTATVAAHLRELDFTGERATIRDTLRVSLEEHGKALGAYDSIAKPENDRAFVKAMSELVDGLDRAASDCLGTMTESAAEIQGGNENAREVVVLVEPKWPASFGEDAPAMGVFGTGFLVRWRGTDGRVEARVVTNAHVMSGAPEANVFTSDAMRDEDPDALRPKGEDAKKDTKYHWLATVLRTSEDDDIAVLRVSPNAPGMPRTGMAFRLSPPKEQEPVVAAGFPGIGGQPSFQISKGNVSNAELGSTLHPFGTYIQHTAAIDPGNSGGPLIDANARLLGVNTLKVRNRENVGIAIPTARVQLALMRAQDRRAPTLMHAEAACNALVSAFSAYAPSRGAVDRVSLTLFDPTQRTIDARLNAYRERVQGAAESPVADYRARAYARLRAAVEDQGGVPRLSRCEDVKPSAHGAYTGTFHTRTSTMTARFAEEPDGVVRLVDLR